MQDTRDSRSGAEWGQGDVDDLCSLVLRRLDDGRARAQEDLLACTGHRLDADLVATCARSMFEDTRAGAIEHGVRGIAVKAYTAERS